ncbi:hypothetical protein [Solidesulfovibrio sp. C21]|uniref:hypothetical protein n=1 Tax=Solidesulfovibrio sp. C21 TaxID=3398613 RepID=UPI0039FBBD18
MTDHQFECHMQMLSAILEELQRIWGLLEVQQAPKDKKNIKDSTNAMSGVEYAERNQ